MKNTLATVEDLSGLTLDELKDMANTFGEKCQQAAKKTVQDAIAAGTALLAAKAKLVHGEWGGWLSANFDYDRRTAYRYMDLAANVTRVTNEEPESMAAAFRMLGSSETVNETTETVPRESRKPAKVKVSPVGQQLVQADHIVDADEMVDDDPTPDPPTIRKTASGSQKAKEADKPKPRPMVPEVLPDDPEPSDPIQEWIETHTLSDLVTLVVAKTCNSNDAAARKKAAKELRKLADKLDPPTKFTRPDLEEVSAYFRELNAADPDSFFDFYESKGWMVGKVSMKDWRASARKWVRENHANGKGNGNGTHLGSNGRPTVEKRKITYK